MKTSIRNQNHLILGAAGALGYGHVKALLERGAQVTVLVRSAEQAHVLFGEHENLDIAVGDIYDRVLFQNPADCESVKLAGDRVASTTSFLRRRGAFWTPSRSEDPHSDGGPVRKAVAQPVTSLTIAGHRSPSQNR